MGILRIHLLGSFRLFQDLALREIRVIPNIQALLALLLLRRSQMQSRERIASLLWEESSQEQAHSCLNTAIGYIVFAQEITIVPKTLENGG